MSDQPIYLDATMLYRWRHLAPVGIVRLERLLTAHLRFRSQLGPATYVLWDSGYRTASDDETAHLDRLLAAATIEMTDESADEPAPLRDVGATSSLATMTFADADSSRRSIKSRARTTALATLARFPDHLRPFAEQAAWATATLAVESTRHAKRSWADRRGGLAMPTRQVGVSHTIDLSRGGDLVALGLGWEYLDHEAMFRLRTEHGLRIHMPAFDLIPVVMPQMNAGQSHLVHRYYAEMAHYADTITSISEATTAELRRFYTQEMLPIPQLATNPLPGFGHTGAPAEHAARRGGRRHRLQGQTFVLSVSTIEIRKNHLLLAKLWAECRREGIELPTLVVVGRIGWDVAEFVRWMEHAPELRDHAMILVDVDDDELAWLYQDALFTVFPSRIEGWGLPITEALDHGKVCIHSTDPAQFEASQGLMPALHPDDYMGWKSEVIRMTTDDRYRTGLERAITDRYRPRTPEQYCMDYEAILRDRRRG